MLNVLIIEDEPLAAKRLIRLLKQLEPEIHILNTIDTVDEAVSWLKKEQADLIFLDIHLADGNSFAIFDQVSIQTPIIFSTAYDQYAIQAFKLNSIDYLLKPIEKDELAQSLKKFHNTQQNASPFDISALVEAMQEKPQKYQQRFMITSGEKIKSVQVEEVAYFFGQQKYVFLVTHDNRKHIIDYTLGKLETLLDPNQFYRINRQFIINFSAIQNMYAYSKSRIKIELEPPSDIDAIVSIEKTPKFKKWLNR